MHFDLSDFILNSNHYLSKLNVAEKNLLNLIMKSFQPISLVGIGIQTH